MHGKFYSLLRSTTCFTQESRFPSGEFPKWLKGSFLQTGPGLLDLPNFTMNNYLDGYAILSHFNFDGSRVKLTKIYPETESYKKAIETGKPYFTEYGTTAKREGSKAGIFAKIVTTFVSCFDMNAYKYVFKIHKLKTELQNFH